MHNTTTLSSRVLTAGYTYAEPEGSDSSIWTEVASHISWEICSPGAPEMSQLID